MNERTWRTCTSTAFILTMSAISAYAICGVEVRMERACCGVVFCCADRVECVMEVIGIEICALLVRP